MKILQSLHGAGFLASVWMGNDFTATANLVALTGYAALEQLPYEKRGLAAMFGTIAASMVSTFMLTSDIRHEMHPDSQKIQIQQGAKSHATALPVGNHYELS